MLMKRPTHDRKIAMWLIEKRLVLAARTSSPGFRLSVWFPSSRPQRTSVPGASIVRLSGSGRLDLVQ